MFKVEKTPPHLVLDLWSEKINFYRKLTIFIIKDNIRMEICF